MDISVCVGLQCAFEILNLDSVTSVQNLKPTCSALHANISLFLHESGTFETWFSGAL